MTILKFVNKYINKKMVSEYFILSVITWGVGMYLPLLNGNFIDSITNRGSIESIKKFLIMIAVLSIIKIGCTYILSVLNNKLTTKITFDINFQVLKHVKELPVFFFHNMNSAYLNQRIYTDSTALSGFFINDVKNFVINIFSIIISITILAVINYKIALVLLILVPLYIVLYRTFKNRLYLSTLNCKESENEFFSESNYQLENIKFIKYNSLFSVMNCKLNEKFDVLFRNTIKLVKQGSLFSSSGMMITVLGNIIILALGVQQILEGELTIGQYTIIGTYFNSIINSVDFFLSFLEVYQKALVSYDRIKELISNSLEKNGEETVQEIKKISIKDLSFKYRGGTQIFNKFSYEFERGKIYRISGENGKGKSSIINMIIGLYNGEYSGSIEYDGVDILNLDMYKIREKHIGIVEQEPTLLRESILENITYNLKDYSDEKCKYLIEKLNLNEFLSKLKDGLQTNIAENNYNISGGEKQKISIIRTLLKNPDLIVLDEANSALDINSVQALKSLLLSEKKDKIIIIISHGNAFDEIIDENVILGEANL